MQFVTDGPDIPEALLQAHEEGRVVFFCGAGISYPAEFPGFKGLVENIYRLIGTKFEGSEEATFRRGEYDATLHQLEQRLPGQREGLGMRRALMQVLSQTKIAPQRCDGHTFGAADARPYSRGSVETGHDQFRSSFRNRCSAIGAGLQLLFSAIIAGPEEQMGRLGLPARSAY